MTCLVLFWLCAGASGLTIDCVRQIDTLFEDIQAKELFVKSIDTLGVASDEAVREVEISDTKGEARMEVHLSNGSALTVDTSSGRVLHYVAPRTPRTTALPEQPSGLLNALREEAVSRLEHLVRLMASTDAEVKPRHNDLLATGNPPILRISYAIVKKGVRCGTGYAEYECDQACHCVLFFFEEDQIPDSIAPRILPQEAERTARDHARVHSGRASALALDKPSCAPALEMHKPMAESSEATGDAEDSSQNVRLCWAVAFEGEPTPVVVYVDCETGTVVDAIGFQSR